MTQPHSPEARLAHLGICLPTLTVPVAAYIPTRLATCGSTALLAIAGQIPFRDGVVICKGPVPSVVSTVEAAAAARQCALNGLAHARAALGTLDRVRQVVRVGVWVQCDPRFGDQPKVANGASELLLEIFGDAGKHARAAVGSIALPLDATVEVEMLLEVSMPQQA